MIVPHFIAVYFLFFIIILYCTQQVSHEEQTAQHTSTESVSETQQPATQTEQSTTAEEESIRSSDINIVTVSQPPPVQDVITSLRDSIPTKQQQQQQQQQQVPSTPLIPVSVEASDETSQTVYSSRSSKGPKVVHSRSSSSSQMLTKVDNQVFIGISFSF